MTILPDVRPLLYLRFDAEHNGTLEDSVRVPIVPLTFLLACAALAAPSAQLAAQTDALFDFHSNPWLNLHHILWARGTPAVAGGPAPPDHRALREAAYDRLADALAAALEERLLSDLGVS